MDREQQRCENCDYWHNTRCAYSPPIRANQFGYGLFPITKPDEWCGRWFNEDSMDEESVPALSPGVSEDVVRSMIKKELANQPRPTLRMTKKIKDELVKQLKEAVGKE